MLELLFEYRYLIWVVGGILAYWLIFSLPSWQRVARTGTWNAERDMAAWRVRNAMLGLFFLVPLLVATTYVAIQ